MQTSDIAFLNERASRWVWLQTRITYDPPRGGARTRRHETESKDCNGSSVCRKGGYGRGIMSNPNPQSGLAPLRGLRKQTAPFYRGRLLG